MWRDPLQVADDGERASIISTAHDLVRAKGYRAASRAATASAAEIDAQVVARHFATDDDLLVAVLQDHQDRQWQVAADFFGRGEAETWDLLAGIGDMVSMDERFLDAWISLVADHLDDDGPIGRYLDRRYTNVLEGIAMFFQSAIENGEILADTDATLEARLLASVLDGLSLQGSLTSSPFDFGATFRHYVEGTYERLRIRPAR